MHTCCHYYLEWKMLQSTFSSNWTAIGNWALDSYNECGYHTTQTHLSILYKNTCAYIYIYIHIYQHSTRYKMMRHPQWLFYCRWFVSTEQSAPPPGWWTGAPSAPPHWDRSFGSERRDAVHKDHGGFWRESATKGNWCNDLRVMYICMQYIYIYKYLHISIYTYW